MIELEIIWAAFLLLLGLGLAGAIVYLCIGAVGLILLIPQLIAVTIISFVVSFVSVVIAVVNEFLRWSFRMILSTLGWKTRRNRDQQNDGGSSGRAEEGRYKTQSPSIDPYQILQVTPEADRKQIKAAYIKAMAQYHPDKVSHLGEEFRILAEEKAKNIQQAYSTLYSV